MNLILLSIRKFSECNQSYRLVAAIMPRACSTAIAANHRKRDQCANQAPLHAILLLSHVYLHQGAGLKSMPWIRIPFKGTVEARRMRACTLPWQTPVQKPPTDWGAPLYV
jgi:hypothetical protein